MMELGIELLSCGATVYAVALSKKGGLFPELARRRIYVLQDKGELRFKLEKKADLIIAGSAVCASWIESTNSTPMAGTIAILNHEQLRKLAKCIHHQELQALQNIRFQSEREVAKYIRDSRANYQSVLTLLDSGTEFVRNFRGHEVVSTIAHDIFSYVVNSANIALQNVRNYRLRSQYLTKISNHANELMQQVRLLNPRSLIEVEKMATEASQFRNLTMEFIRKPQTSISRNLSILLKETDMTFPQLIARYQYQLKFPGKFENLQDVQKIQVYEEIITVSGRGKSWLNKLSKVVGSLGIAMLLFTAGLIVWDIFSSEHKIITATENCLSVVALIGGVMLGRAAGNALGISLACWVGVEVSSPALLIGAGIAGSFAGGFLLGLFASFLAGYFISGLLASTSTAFTTTNTTDYYLAPMPDAEALARQILYCDIHHSG